jgi:hypothetical protein
MQPLFPASPEVPDIGFPRLPYGLLGFLATNQKSGDYAAKTAVNLLAKEGARSPYRLGFSRAVYSPRAAVAARAARAVAGPASKLIPLVGPAMTAIDIAQLYFLIKKRDPTPETSIAEDMQGLRNLYGL